MLLRVSNKTCCVKGKPEDPSHVFRVLSNNHSHTWTGPEFSVCLFWVHHRAHHDAGIARVSEATITQLCSQKKLRAVKVSTFHGRMTLFKCSSFSVFIV